MPLTRAFNSNSNARRKLEVYCASKGQLAGTEGEHATGENNADFSEPVDRRDTYFPLRLHKPPGETIEMAIERSPRFFSPRELAMHLVATNEYATFPPRCTTTALRIIEPHPRCARAHAKRGDADEVRAFNVVARSLE